jgi:hypothetical protein
MTSEDALLEEQMRRIRGDLTENRVWETPAPEDPSQRHTGQCVYGEGRFSAGAIDDRVQQMAPWRGDHGV